MSQPQTTPEDRASRPDPAAKLTLLERREIEARIVGPLLGAVQAELGPERTRELVRRVVADLARQAGAEQAQALGSDSLHAFAACVDRWRTGGALEFDLIAQDAGRLEFNVTRCRFAEMYRALGLAEYGSSLSCCRDFALVEGFNRAITLTRTQTLMEGAPCCDFRFRLKSAGSETEADEPEGSAS